MYWPLRSALEHSAPLRWFGRVTDLLWVARRCLELPVRQFEHQAKGRLLDVGCGSQPYRRYFTYVDRHVGVDLPGSFGPRDAYTNGMRLPFYVSVFDAVLCNQVLVHVPEPHTLMSEAARVLWPGGVLILTTSQVWALHHEPHD